MSKAAGQNPAAAAQVHARCLVALHKGCASAVGLIDEVLSAGVGVDDRVEVSGIGFGLLREMIDARLLEARMLPTAVRAGHLEGVDRLLRAGARVGGIPGVSGKTAAHVALAAYRRGCRGVTMRRVRRPGQRSACYKVLDALMAADAEAFIRTSDLPAPLVSMVSSGLFAPVLERFISLHPRRAIEALSDPSSRIEPGPRIAEGFWTANPNLDGLRVLAGALEPRVLNAPGANGNTLMDAVLASAHLEGLCVLLGAGLPPQLSASFRDSSSAIMRVLEAGAGRPRADVAGCIDKLLEAGEDPNAREPGCEHTTAAAVAQRQAGGQWPRKPPPVAAVESVLGEARSRALRERMGALGGSGQAPENAPGL